MHNGCAIEVLNEKGAAYYISPDEKVQSLPTVEEEYICGLFLYHPITYWLKKVGTQYRFIYEGSGKDYFTLMGRQSSEQLTFINGKDSIQSDDLVNYIRVKRNGLYGLFEYDYDSVEKDKGKCRAIRTLLPIQYNAIYHSKKGGKIFFVKGGKTGVYGKHKTPVYTLFERVTAHFYKIAKNGKQGWLDINTLQEYF